MSAIIIATTGAIAIALGVAYLTADYSDDWSEMDEREEVAYLLTASGAVTLPRK